MFKDQVCFKPKLPLRNGIKNSSSPSTSFVKVRITNTKNIITKKLGKELLITGVVLIAFSLVILASSGYLIYTHQIWSLKVMTSQDCPPDVLRDINLTSFSYDQLAVATNDFMEEIGKGASGRVYKGSVPENGGKEIAVKRLEKLGCYGAGELKKVVGEVEVNLEELEKMVKIGLWCVQTEIDLRPTMKQVILMMDGTIVTPPPPPPPNSAANN
ncbi:hypothetical protein OIU77_002849 [Salix suchowensis]|uniref:Uncharacterized protein n=1 Tax=Salix suchowensis TaxID=1278906 RepID=A0ABQ9AXK5_9ROSI|nr:hypothetical protein OIU77_002849 [Salix suchowensis]